MMTSPLPKFSSPPLNEMLFCVYFRDLSELHGPTLGKFQELLGQDYQKIETVPALPPLIGNPSYSGALSYIVQEAPILPRTWFTNGDGTSLIQVQRDRIVFNWRQIRENDKYPSYEFVSKEFRSVMDKFSQFCQHHVRQPIDIVALELDYINHILIGREIECLKDIGKVFPMFAWGSLRCETVQNLKNLSSDFEFELPGNGGALHAAFRYARKISDGMPILKFDLIARKIANTPSTEMWEWFELAHVKIVNTFASITDEGVQKQVWGLQS